MHGTAKSSSWQEKKEREDKEREARIAQGMADSVNHIRNIEQSKLDKKLRERNFQLYDVSDWLQTGITEKELSTEIVSLLISRSLQMETVSTKQ